MGNYRLRIQLQHGHDDVVSPETYNESYPCNINTASRMLDELKRRGQNNRSDDSWRAAVGSAIEEMRSWIRGSRNLSAHSGTTHQENFSWHNYDFRVDLEINAGTHFPN